VQVQADRRGPPAGGTWPVEGHEVEITWSCRSFSTSESACTPEACAIALQDQHPRHHRVAGEVPGEEGLVDRDVLDRDAMLGRQFHTRSMSRNG